MFERLFIEKELLEHPRAIAIREKFKHLEQIEIDRYDQIWGRAHRPYLEKRKHLQIFLAKKRGTLIKEAPDAYGKAGAPHYYFVHAYNCIYECEYCYLQGHFSTPDLVFFLNHEDILEEMQTIVDDFKGEEIWFHAGEFSDSLAMSHITGELPLYFDFFKKNLNAKLELRTKSVNIKELLQIPAQENVICSFSLSPKEVAKKIDRGVPSVKSRLLAISKITQQGHPIAIHLDPITYGRDFETEYAELLSEISEAIPLEKIKYISLGVVRFTKNVYHQTQVNYPDSLIHKFPMSKSFDGKIRYKKPLRRWMLTKLKTLCLELGIKDESVYYCMED